MGKILYLELYLVAISIPGVFHLPCGRTVLHHLFLPNPHSKADLTMTLWSKIICEGRELQGSILSPLFPTSQARAAPLIWGTEWYGYEAEP